MKITTTTEKDDDDVFPPDRPVEILPPLVLIAKIATANVPTESGWKYSVEVLHDVLKHPGLVDGTLLGILGPSDESKIRLGMVSHQILRMWLDDTTLMAEIKVLDTPQGKLLRTLLKAGNVVFRLSGEGISSASNIVQRPYKLVSINAISAISAQGIIEV